ncbi:MAG: Spy/CpxP family protein refolding chaperone [Calditrichia bacterium]
MKRALILAITLLLATAVVFAGNPDKKRGKHGLRGLDLTEEQRSQVADLRLDMQKEMITVRAQVAGLRAELKLAMVADKFDEGKVKNLHGKLSELRAKMSLKKLMNKRAVRDLLTPDQQKKFDMKMLSERGQRGGKKGKGMRGGKRGKRGRYHGEVQGAEAPEQAEESEADWSQI